MRQVLIVTSIACCLLSFFSLSSTAQHVVKIAIPKVKASAVAPTAKASPVTVPMKKIPSVNARKIMQANLLIRDAKADTIPVPKDSVEVVDSVALAKAIQDSTQAADTAASKDTVTAATSAACEKLKQVVNLDLDKKVTGEYVFSLVNDKDNPLSTFTLKQFNESLFTDQLKIGRASCRERV